MPRLSSPLDAKASVRSPYALDRSQQNSCVGTVCRPAVRSAEQRPHMRFDLSLQTMMSSQVSPPSPRGGRTNPSIHDVIRRSGTPLRKLVIRDRCNAFSTSGGARRDRTDDLMLAKHALYQLSYGPGEKPPGGRCRSTCPPKDPRKKVVGPGRLELPTSRLSGVCSNRLSYRPLKRRVPARPGQAIAPQPLSSAAMCAERETKTATPCCLCGVCEQTNRT